MKRFNIVMGQIQWHPEGEFVRYDDHTEKLLEVNKICGDLADAVRHLHSIIKNLQVVAKIQDKAERDDATVVLKGWNPRTSYTRSKSVKPVQIDGKESIDGKK